VIQKAIEIRSDGLDCWLEEAEEEVDDNGQDKGNAKKSRPQAVIKVSLSPFTNCLRTPMVGHQGIYHTAKCNKREQDGTYPADLIAKVEQANCKAAEHNSEIQP